MTHRPRTDIFSHLPNLIALANLKELIDHHSLEEHALRLQKEAAQMAKLQYLQYLFPPQPPASSNIATSSNQINNIGIFSDMEAFNLLNSLASLKASPSVSSLSQLDLSASSLQGINDSIPFSHLPDLQIPCNYQAPPTKGMVQASELTVFSQGENSPISPFHFASSSTPFPPSIAPPVTQISSMVNSLGDASSPSSYGEEAPSVWHDILEDPLFQDIA
ncbi:hypothetical protein SADUNF_Sadunf07G0082000 [Salix dunnii]|uniref:Uncharacterized protein n=1 Tax=Salix dunnii TaxID=1413687 RepID=A0A835N2D5_9ROSI|nr:hypothetical protein SADUNF_Sadunf07G0082000 [Salix dunnii]